MGTSTVAVANGTAPSLYATGMVLSPAFGDAPAFRAALAQVTILDGFGRDFTAMRRAPCTRGPTCPTCSA